MEACISGNDAIGHLIQDFRGDFGAHIVARDKQDPSFLKVRSHSVLTVPKKKPCSSGKSRILITERGPLLDALFREPLPQL